MLTNYIVSFEQSGPDHTKGKQNRQNADFSNFILFHSRILSSFLYIFIMFIYM